jgi:hypothetical protein
MSSPAAAATPDPYKVASAEGKSNIQTGIANSVMGNPNIYGPSGSTTYSPSGQFETITMPDGSTQRIQRQNQTTTLSAPEQSIYDINTQTRQQVGQIGLDQSRLIGDILGKPIDLSGLQIDPNSFSGDRSRVEQSIYDRNAPQLQRELEAEQNRLTNQGFQQGTEGWKQGMDDYNRRLNDFRLGVTERGLAEQQGMYGMASNAAQQEMQRRLMQQNQPINAITALMSGSQVSMPNTPGYNAPTIQGTNVGQNIYNSAALENQNYQAKMAQQNAMMGGVAGLAGAGLFGGMKYGFNPMKWGGG